jgi:uncharacterized membrane protein
MPHRSTTGSRLFVEGNAVQPLLLMFPLGLLALAAMFDLSRTAGAPDLVGRLAYCTIVGGLLGGIVTATVSWVDAALARHPHALRVGALRLLLDLAVLIFFAVVVLVRMRTPGRTADPGILLMEVLGLVLAGFTAWFAGRLGGTRVPRREPVHDEGAR